MVGAMLSLSLRVSLEAVQSGTVRNFSFILLKLSFLTLMAAYFQARPTTDERKRLTS